MQERARVQTIAPSSRYFAAARTLAVPNSDTRGSSGVAAGISIPSDWYCHWKRDFDFESGDPSAQEIDAPMRQRQIGNHVLFIITILEVPFETPFVH
jgi:hypothetical protein